VKINLPVHAVAFM